jgi:rRNA-processing protein CGR1
MTTRSKSSMTAVFLDAETKNPLSHPMENKNLLEGDIVQMSREPSTKGQNVSGRSWKIRPQKRASSLVKTKVNNQTKTWEERQQEKLMRKEALELQSELREERRKGKVLKKERRLENERRRAENEFKQSQRSAKELNTGRLKSTLKSMSKKQLRQIKKTRMNPRTGTLEYVPVYSK